VAARHQASQLLRLLPQRQLGHSAFVLKLGCAEGGKNCGWRESPEVP
jgi:hypothetical protein